MKRFFDDKIKIAYIIIILLFFSIISLLVSALFVSFSKIHFSRNFPLGYVNTTAKMKLITKKINKAQVILLGDSRALMWDTSSFDNEFNTVNIANGGQTSSQILLQLKSLDIPENKIFILQLGINDIHPIGALKQYKEIIIENCKKNLSDIVNLLRSKNNTVILTNIFPISYPPIERRFFFNVNEAQSIIHEMNRYISTLAQNNKIIILDAFDILKSSNDFLDNKFRDTDFFLHVNNAAYFELNKVLIGIIYNRINDH